MNIEIAFAERAWDYYTGTGTLTRDMAFSQAGFRKVFETQIKAGLLPDGANFDMSKYVADGYLDAAEPW